MRNQSAVVLRRGIHVYMYVVGGGAVCTPKEGMATGNSPLRLLAI